MKRRIFFIGGLLACIIGIGVFLAYQYRTAFRDWMYEARKPALPVAEPYVPASPRAGDTIPAVASSTDALDRVAQKLLDVPFTSQAPHANWDDPYQEACEEASVIMVAAYYRGERGAIDPDEADRRLLALIKTEESTYGYGQDITAQQTAELINGEFSDLHARVFAIRSAEDIISSIANGVPVIVPADGKTLPNPNFRNGGPRYHMLVVIGYTETHFITNDPGTRLGKEFLYAQEDLLSSIHDWNDGDVPRGARVGIAVGKVGSR